MFSVRIKCISSFCILLIYVPYAFLIFKFWTVSKKSGSSLLILSSRQHNSLIVLCLGPLWTWLCEASWTQYSRKCINKSQIHLVKSFSDDVLLLSTDLTPKQHDWIDSWQIKSHFLSFARCRKSFCWMEVLLPDIVHALLLHIHSNIVWNLALCT